MGRVLWRTEMGDRVLEVALTGPHDVDIASDVDPLELGPVQVRGVVAGVEEDLGVADTVADALEAWDELRELGDAVECTCVGEPWRFSEFLYGKVRLAPPPGWADLPHTLGGFEINGEWFELNLQDVPWEEVASIGGEFGGFTLSYLDGWLQQRATDMEDEYRWAGPGPDLEAEGWALVLGPPMWPTGSELDVRLSFVTDSTAPEVVSEFVTPSITEMHSYIVLNGVTIYSREDDDEHVPPSSSGRQLLDATKWGSSVPALPLLPDLGASTPDQSDETIDALRRDLDDAIAGSAPAEEVEQIRAVLGNELLQAGYAEAAIPYLESAADSATQRLGADDEEVLNLRGILGRALTEASLFERAEHVLLGVVDGRTRTLGADDPQTLVARATSCGRSAAVAVRKRRCPWPTPCSRTDCGCSVPTTPPRSTPGATAPSCSARRAGTPRPSPRWRACWPTGSACWVRRTQSSRPPATTWRPFGVDPKDLTASTRGGSSSRTPRRCPTSSARTTRRRWWRGDWSPSSCSVSDVMPRPSPCSNDSSRPARGSSDRTRTRRWSAGG